MRLSPALLALCLLVPAANATTNTAKQQQLEQLGQQLFFDPNLSKNRTQSCSSCHDPKRAFSDGRNNLGAGATSLGDDGASLGGRNAPTAMYAKYIPEFKKQKDGSYKGGLFHDGRARDLADQASGPPLNPVEMGMPDAAAVVARLQENPSYVQQFANLFGNSVLSDPEQGYRAMTQSIAAFERTKAFAPFDSRYDRYLRGEETLTEQELLGESLFFSQQFTNCNRCHQLKRFGGSKGEIFSDFSYHNIGVPQNDQLNAALNERAATDVGLRANPAVTDDTQRGKFRVPTLRNIAVTGPYMHNGVFKDLRTVVLYYDKFNNDNRVVNPETGQPWNSPEVSESQSLTHKEFKAPALTDEKIDALVAFMETLTDKQFEPLLEK